MGGVFYNDVLTDEGLYDVDWPKKQSANYNQSQIKPTPVVLVHVQQLVI